MEHGWPLLAVEPLGMIQGETSHREKEKKREAQHREVSVQPARQMRELPLPMQIPWVV
jgi:hypothetical protein